MAKTVTTGFVTDTVNGIKINSGIRCNAGNLNNNASRNVAYVVMHYTGNTKDTAKANATYFSGAGRNASAHFFADDSEIYQSVELRDTAWHCGAKSYKHNACRNANSIGIEMCCTAGNYRISEKTKKNAAYLCAFLCKMLGISAGGVDTYVLRHYDVTGKSCPAQMVQNPAEWQEFKNMVKSILGGTAGSTGAKQDTPKNTQNGGDSIGKGNTVTFTGGPVYKSSTAESATTQKNVTSVCEVTAVNYKGKHPYHCISKDGKGVYGWVNADSVNGGHKTTQNSTGSYKVKVTADVLNVRKGPGTNYGIATQVKQGEVYTIVAEEKNGSTTWGKLKSGAGYISLGYTKRV